MQDTNSQIMDPQLSQGHWIIDGTGWSFFAALYDTTNIDHKNIILEPANIKLFEYTNQFNALVITGQLVYQDANRQLGKLFRIPHLLAKVVWSENEAKKKVKFDEKGNKIKEWWVEKKVKREDYFTHMFLVNKMEIVEHNAHTDVTTYRLELVSILWYKLSQVCQYSNYNLKKPEPITDIICRLLVDAVGLERVVTKSFIEAPCKSDVCIYYTTTQKDNYFTAINYLLNRMYMEPSSFDVDNHPRIILWDEKENKFKMAKLGDDKTCLYGKDNLIQLSRYYEIQDYELNPFSPGNMGAFDIKPTITAISKMSYTRFIKDYYTRHYWDMSITKDKFVRRIIMNEKIQNLFKSQNAQPDKMATYFPNLNITQEKDVPGLKEFIANKTNYLIDESKWSNQRHLYNDCLQGVLNRDSFILSRENRVCHQPWQCFYLLRDKQMMKEKKFLDTDKLELKDSDVNGELGETAKPKTKNDDYSDNQFFGAWYTYKITHSITITGTVKESVPTMIEKIQFVKPWEITPAPQKLRK